METETFGNLVNTNFRETVKLSLETFSNFACKAERGIDSQPLCNILVRPVLLFGRWQISILLMFENKLINLANFGQSFIL